ncbi:hypothetical protein [Sinorhizobium chiapasense]|uniref:Uncharacterized protein n=1 Tax=Sinorhizobium chiapasense TaxID=501572 RepID=A0ABZ2BKP5_9HYPH
MERLEARYYLFFGIRAFHTMAAERSIPAIAEPLNEGIRPSASLPRIG